MGRKSKPLDTHSEESKCAYHLAPLYCRPWTLNGISPRLIESHYENNYGAALNRFERYLRGK